MNFDSLLAFAHKHGHKDEKRDGVIYLYRDFYHQLGCSIEGFFLCPSTLSVRGLTCPDCVDKDIHHLGLRFKRRDKTYATDLISTSVIRGDEFRYLDRSANETNKWKVVFEVPVGLLKYEDRGRKSVVFQAERSTDTVNWKIDITFHQQPVKHAMGVMM